ncbi:MAG TPA: TOBE domain-containing protein [Xanthobacteraceae bacterium]|nr:TOBE domain-containing protein [Xanthobacteraceae bacterium]
MALGDRIVVMRKGAIAQIGTPREIYFAPANRFVAEFVGAANIVEAACDGTALTLPGGKLPIAKDAMNGHAINGHANGPVFAMIRPESIRIVAADGASLAGQVDSVSFVGDRQRAWIGGVAAKAISVDVPNSIAIKAGDRVGLAVDPQSIRLLPRDQ